MSRRGLLVLLCLLAWLPSTAAAAEPRDDRALPPAFAARALTQDSAPPPALGVPAPAPPVADHAPSLLGALARLIAAVLVLAVVMTGCVLGYRRLVQRHGAGAGGMFAWAAGWSAAGGPDAVRITARQSLGGREAVAVAHVGGERFLLGVAPGHVSLLARLEPTGEATAEFSDALAQAAAPARVPRAEAADAEHALREAVGRARGRLGRLAHLAVVARDARD